MDTIDLKTIDTDSNPTIWDAVFKLNEVIRRVNGQSALIQLQKNEIDKLKEFQKEVERVYPFGNNTGIKPEDILDYDRMKEEFKEEAEVERRRRDLFNDTVNKVTNEQIDICKKCGKDLTPRTDGEKLVKWFREYNGV